jgi:uncharacterized glyoxalase superfamily protein PhnB
MSIALDMVGLVVANIEDSIRFYRLLGITIPDPDPESPYAEATLPSGLRISWNQIEMIKSIDPDWVQPVGQRVSMAFLCDSPEAVDNRFEVLTSAGYKGHKEPWDAFWGQRYAIVLDPDGLAVDLFAYLPEV